MRPVVLIALMSLSVGGCTGFTEPTPGASPKAVDTQTYWSCVSETAGRSGEDRSRAMERCIQQSTPSTDK